METRRLQRSIVAIRFPGRRYKHATLYPGTVHLPQKFLVPYADPEYAEILLYLAQNEWSFEHHATAAATQEAMVASWERVNAIAPITDLAWRMLHPGDGPEAPSADTLGGSRP